MLSYISWYYLFSFIMISVIYRSYLYSWHWLLCYVSFQLSCCYCLCCYTRHLTLYTHTLIRLLLTTLDSHFQNFGYLLILFRCSCDRTLLEELELFSFLILVSLPLFMLLFFDSCISHFASFHSLIHLRSCAIIICIIAVIVDYYDLDL